MLYTKLKHLEKEIKELETLGVVDTSWRRNIRIVEEYTALRDKGVCVYCCYEFIAKDEGISASSVKKIIKRLMT
ncbi:MAG: hypothetical protein C0512_07410 [Flavobacterium sp.]|nr:hypothetical protein [Flavobacterium sp.]